MRKARVTSERTWVLSLPDSFNGTEVGLASSIDTTARLPAPVEGVSFDIMEEAIYYATIVAVIAFGLVAGNCWARSRGEAVLIGLGGTTIAVVVFVCLIVVASIFSPDS